MANKDFAIIVVYDEQLKLIHYFVVCAMNANKTKEKKLKKNTSQQFIELDAVFVIVFFFGFVLPGEKEKH